jgi:hypothetical protein
VDKDDPMVFSALSEAVAMQSAKEGDFFKIPSPYFSNLSTDFACSLLTAYSESVVGTRIVDETLDLIAKRITCFLPFEKSFVETIYNIHKEDEESYLFKFLHKHSTSFSKDAQDYIMMIFILEDSQDLLKGMK